MIFSSDRDVEHIAVGLLRRTLPKFEWNHAAHFAAALWLLRHCPHLVEGGGMPALIQAYNESTGTANTDNSGYHETITVASLRAAAAFLGRYANDIPLHRIANDLLASRFGDPAWLMDYRSRPRLFSAEARRRWIAPDIEGLPFPRLRTSRLE